MVLTVLAVADQVSPLLYDYFDASRWKEIDLVVSCGDLPPEYLDFLMTSLAVPVFYVRGNHDGGYEPSQYGGIENIDGKIVSYRGVRFAGFEGSMRYNKGNPQYTEAQMAHRLRRMRIRARLTGAPHVLVAHAPPAHCHEGQDLCHQGFESFRTAIRLWHPQYFVHGHVHAYDGASRTSVVGDTTVINAFPYRLFTVEVPTRTAGIPHERLVVRDDEGPGRLANRAQTTPE